MAGAAVGAAAAVVERSAEWWLLVVATEPAVVVVVDAVAAVDVLSAVIQAIKLMFGSGCCELIGSECIG